MSNTNFLIRQLVYKMSCFPGENPSEPKGTRVIFKLVETKKKEFQPDEWGAKLGEISEEKLTILVNEIRRDKK